MPIIEVDHLTKEYRLGAIQGLKQTLLNTAARLTGKKVEERPLFKALDDVTFSVEQGEVVGIIGHNGAGKSTLLKMLAKISTPTRGTVKVDGRIAPLIEVGAGFVLDFTGRENVYLNGAILGMPRQEIDKKFDEIVDFAEMAEFIDTPVKRYSSGMQVKLAFAVATSIEAEILIVDEVLAVGDLAFQRKCFDRMEDLIKRQGKTVLLVSHNIRQIERISSRVLLFDHGRIVADGEPTPTCDLFYRQSDERIGENIKGKSAAGRHETSGTVDLVSAQLLDTSGSVITSVKHGQDIMVSLVYKIHENLVNPVFGMGFHTPDFLYLATDSSQNSMPIKSLEAGTYEIRSRIKAFPFLPGLYSLRAGVAAGQAYNTEFYAENILHFAATMDLTGKIWAESVREGFIPLDMQWALTNETL